jgi:CIC family chloride channel protein
VRLRAGGSADGSADAGQHDQRLFPVIDANRRLVGVLTRRRLKEWLDGGDPRPLEEVMKRQPVVAYDNDPLRVVVFRMAETGLTRLPVVTGDGTLVGLVALTDLLTARARILEADRRRERVLGARLRLPAMFRGRAA